MNLTSPSATVQPGDLVELISPTNKTYILRVESGKQLQTHRGVVNLDTLIGVPWGSEVTTHIGRSFFLLQPSLSDLLREIKRNTQILYTKDIGLILVMLGIGPGVHVLECGTGSGALTTALAWAVGPTGKVSTYEVKAPNQDLARKNIERLGFQDRVEFKLRDITEGFDETAADAVFLDLPNPYDYIDQVRAALKPGGFFGSILPTTNQVSRLVAALQRGSFAFVDVCEVILRFYKPVPERLRPTDRMVAHTGFLIFGRPMIPGSGLLPHIETPPGELQEERDSEELIGGGDPPDL
jgi:tRNA (adenine57-N1/adenine58-N1)-methyltransferase